MIQKISGINLGNTCKQASGNLKTQKQQRQLLFRQLAPQYPVSDFNLGFHRIDRNAQPLRHLAVFHIFQHHQLQNHPALFRQIIHRFPHRRSSTAFHTGVMSLSFVSSYSTFLAASKSTKRASLSTFLKQAFRTDTHK